MAVLSNLMHLQVSQAPWRDFQQRLPLKGKSVIFRKFFVKARSEDEPHMPKSDMPHLPCILNSIYLMGMRKMQCGELMDSIIRKESLHKIECVREMKCPNLLECFKIEECVEMKNMKVDLNEKKKMIQCLAPVKCVRKKECARRLDCLFEEKTNEDSFSLKKLVKEFGVSLVTCLQPATWSILLLISFVLTQPNMLFFQVACKGVWNFLKFWYKPSRFSIDWCGRNFMTYRGNLMKLGQKYAMYLPQPVVACFKYYGIKPGKPIEFIGWVCTLGSLATFATLACTFLYWFLRSSLIWLVNIILQFYIWLKDLLPRLY